MFFQFELRYDSYMKNSNEAMGDRKHIAQHTMERGFSNMSSYKKKAGHLVQRMVLVTMTTMVAGVAVIGTGSPVLAAVEQKADVKLQWEVALPEGTQTYYEPIVGKDGTMYLQTSTGGRYGMTYKMTAYSKQGKEEWSHVPSGSAALVPSAVYKDVVYIADRNQLQAFYKNGESLWSLPYAENFGNGVKEGADGNLLLSSYNGLTSVTADGEARWSHTAERMIHQVMTGQNGTAYYSNRIPTDEWYDLQLTGLNADGTIGWQQVFENGRELLQAPDGTFFVAGFNQGQGYVTAVGADGAVKWTHVSAEAGGDVSMPAVGEDGTVYVATSNAEHGYLEAIAPNGERKWLMQTEGAQESFYSNGQYQSVHVSGDTVYAVSVVREGEQVKSKLYALSLEGQVKWTQDFGSTTAGVELGSDGTLYLLENVLQGGAQFSKRLHAFGTEGELWQYGDEQFRPDFLTVGDGGMIYLVGGGKVTVLK